MDVVALRRLVEGMLSSLSVPSLRWALVTQASPLRIQYVNEEPLPFTPVVLGLAPTLGTGVLTVRWGTQTVVLGGIGTAPPAPDPPPDPPPGAKLVKTTNQTYPAGTWTKITFTASVYSDEPNFSDVANSRLVIPVAGRYMVGASIAHPTSYGSTQTRQAIIVRGDAAPNTSGNQLLRMGFATPSGILNNNGATVEEFAAGEYVTLWWRSTFASNFGAPDSEEPFNMWAQKVR